MMFLKSKKAGLADVNEWFLAAIIAFVLGFLVAVLMSRAVIPDFIGLF